MRPEECSGILVYLETADGVIRPVSLELLGEAFRMAQKSGEKLYAVGICRETGRVIQQLEGTGVQEVFLYRCEEEFQADIYEKAVAECIREKKPSIVLIGGTIQGRALAPRLAVAFRTGLTADCTQLELDEKNQLVQIRPAFGGNIMASILTEHVRPQMATVRPGIFKPAEKIRGQKPEIYERAFAYAGDTARLVQKTPVKKEAGIDSQDLLIVAGRGVKKKEDLEMLRDLARRMGGKLASSRALVEKGWMKAEEQIGLSGTTVAPKCMITFGVSGTVQFMAGMKNTPNIIAVNTDPDARIFEIAHFPICADLYDVVPAMIKALQEKEIPE